MLFRSLDRRGMHRECFATVEGNCWDNALAESFFNSLKDEPVFGRRYATRTAARADPFEYIERFTTAVAVIPRSATVRRFSPCKTGSPSSMSRKWRLNTMALEDKKPREAQREGHMIAEG